MKFGLRSSAVAMTLAISLGALSQLTEANAGLVINPEVTELGLTMRENAELGRMPTMFFSVVNPADNRTFRICKDIDDSICTEGKEIKAITNLAPCTTTSQLSCIASIWAIDPSGKKIPGELTKNAGVDPRYKTEEIASIDFPRSDGLGSVWKIPGVINSSGSDSYFVATQMTGGTNKSSGELTRNSKFWYGNLISGIMPIQEVGANVQLLSAVDGSINPGGGFGSNGTQYAADGSVCAATEVGVCYAVRQFPEGYKFGMTLRLSEKLSGWFHGRLYLPSITINEWKSGQEISIEAEAVKVPSLEFTVPNAEIPKAIRDLVFNGREWGMKGDGKERTFISEDLAGKYSMDLVSGFAPAYKDKATTTDSFWSFKTLNQDGTMNDVMKCSAENNALSGLVTTNALAYSAGPPTYEKESGSLNYKVASPHFEADGKIEALGSYDLALRSDVARCIYGFSRAPISAEISITSKDGERKVATTLVNERNGWLYLSAKGFTFSSPVINVKLTQEVVIAPTPTPTPSKSAIKKVVKISCVKGKSKKTVSGIAPTCPKGYKITK